MTSCNDESTSDSVKSPQLLFAIEEFQNTNFYLSSTLDDYNYKFDQGTIENYSNRTILILPVDNSLSASRLENTSELYVISVFDENMNYEKSVEISNLSTSSLMQVRQEYSGDVAIKIPNDQFRSDYTLKISFEDGVFKSYFLEESSNNNGRVECCGCSDRGVLYCTGRKFQDNEGTVEEILGCYGGFLGCLAYRLIDCTIQECG